MDYSTNTAARIIRQHYQLRRQVTDAEVRAELESLTRKRADGSLDDVIALPLWSALVNAGVLPQ